MIIECPFCKNRAQLAERHEGSKVRCAACSKTYVARPHGQRGGSSFDPTQIFIYGGALLAVGLVWFTMFKNKGDEGEVTLRSTNTGSEHFDPLIHDIETKPRVAEAAAPAAKEPEPVVDVTGWESPLVRAARAVHDTVFAEDSAALADMLDGERIWSERGQPDALASTTDDDRDWAQLAASERKAWTETVAEDLLTGERHDLIANWEPFDGRVEREEDETVVVVLELTSRLDASQPTRSVEWHLQRRDAGWKAVSWTRWYSASEKRALGKAPKKETVKKVLSDGVAVVEGQLRPIPYMDETPAEARAKIDGLIAALIDLDAMAAVRTEARAALVEIGKPAIPGLLTRIAETPLETEEQASQLGLVDMTLREITSYSTTFKPHLALGQSAERRESGLKQWFGWYDRRFRHFEQKKDGPEVDELTRRLRGLGQENDPDEDEND